MYNLARGIGPARRRVGETLPRILLCRVDSDYLLHIYYIFELQKREKGGETSERRPRGMVDVALTP